MIDEQIYVVRGYFTWPTAHDFGPPRTGILQTKLNTDDALKIL